jgi:hypothetical protein
MGSKTSESFNHSNCDDEEMFCQKSNKVVRNKFIQHFICCHFENCKYYVRSSEIFLSKIHVNIHEFFKKTLGLKCWGATEFYGKMG